MVKEIVTNVIVKCRLQTELDVMRRNGRHFFCALDVFDRWADGK